MTDKEERQHVIEVLQKMVDWMEAINYIVATPERRHALLYAIASIETDLKYDLLYEETLEEEPIKGHWVLTDVEGDKVWHCNCSECGKDPQDYVGGSENWWLIKSKLPKFCPNCGSDNREVKE